MTTINIERAGVSRLGIRLTDFTAEDVSPKNWSLISNHWRRSVSVHSTEKGYFVAVFDDITERKRAEEEIQKLA